VRGVKRREREEGTGRGGIREGGGYRERGI
jgi:hypothetical protein